MKKILAIILALLMVLSLVSCGSKNNDEQNSTSNNDAQTNTDTNSGDKDTAGTDDADNTPSIAADVGFLDDEVDHHARDTYDFVYMFTASSALSSNTTKAFQELGKFYNFTITEGTGEGDEDKYISTIELYQTQGIDGFIIDCYSIIKDRTKEVLEEGGSPYILLYNAWYNDDGTPEHPSVLLDGGASGRLAMQWLVDNCATYWGDDYNKSNVALINLDFTPVPDLTVRCEGAKEIFLENYPDCEDKVFLADTVTGTLNAETAFDMSSTIFSANPDIEHWFVFACVEDLAQGASRAAEQLGIDANVLITDTGSDVLQQEWNTNYDGCWVSCVGISSYAYVAPAATGLIALCDGRATPESLWGSLHVDDNDVAFWYADYTMITKDTYKEYFNHYAEMFDMELPYPEAA